MCDAALESRYQLEVLPDDEGPAVALCRAAYREAMSHGWVGAAGPVAPGGAVCPGDAP